MKSYHQQIIKGAGKTAILAGFFLLLTGCAASTLKSPCANFGNHCAQIAINR